jgi:hypothetical protein
MNVQGMSNTFKMGAKKPCGGDCKILALLASLEFFDGSEAENKEGVSKHSRKPIHQFRGLTSLLSRLGSIMPCSSTMALQPTLPIVVRFHWKTFSWPATRKVT